MSVPENSNEIDQKLCIQLTCMHSSWTSLQQCAKLQCTYCDPLFLSPRYRAKMWQNRLPLIHTRSPEHPRNCNRSHCVRFISPTACVTQNWLTWDTKSMMSVFMKKKFWQIPVQQAPELQVLPLSIPTVRVHMTQLLQPLLPLHTKKDFACRVQTT